MSSTHTGERPGIRPTALTQWLADHVGLVAPIEFVRLAGGNSNLTYRVSDTSGRIVVVRRPPLGRVAATAHDVLREARIMSALFRHGIRTPEVLATCDDVEVTGAPFFVMTHLDGIACRTPADARQLSPPARAAAGPAIAAALAQLHSLEPHIVGLDGLGRRDGYVERQLRRWMRQTNEASPDGDPAVADIVVAHNRLADRVPAQIATAVVHADLRLDNCILDTAGTVIGILDWEIATLGDPMADLATLISYWARPGDAVWALEDPPTVADGFPDAAQLIDTYAAGSAVPVHDLEFYVAFAWWRIACIVAGVHARVSHGATLAPGRTVDGYRRQAARLAAHALQLSRALT
jgi:aminoglycoside phosphotransferase (APT) family kinase protein